MAVENTSGLETEKKKEQIFQETCAFLVLYSIIHSLKRK